MELRKLDEDISAIRWFVGLFDKNVPSFSDEADRQMARALSSKQAQWFDTREAQHISPVEPTVGNKYLTPNSAGEGKAAR